MKTSPLPIFIVSLFLANSGSIALAAETSPEAKPEWFACSSSEECVVVKGVCDWEAVRRTAMDAYEHFAAASRPMVECSPLQEKKPGALCLTGRCFIESPSVKRLPAPKGL